MAWHRARIEDPNFWQVERHHIPQGVILRACSGPSAKIFYDSCAQPVVMAGHSAGLIFVVCAPTFFARHWSAHSRNAPVHGGVAQGWRLLWHCPGDRETARPPASAGVPTPSPRAPTGAVQRTAGVCRRGHGAAAPPHPFPRAGNREYRLKPARFRLARTAAERL